MNSLTPTVGRNLKTGGQCARYLRPGGRSRWHGKNCLKRSLTSVIKTGTGVIFCYFQSIKPKKKSPIHFWMRDFHKKEFGGDLDPPVRPRQSTRAEELNYRDRNGNGCNLLSVWFKRFPKKKSPTSLDAGDFFIKRIRRRPTLPPSRPGSTIGAKELNCRDRNGNGCDLLAIATENLELGKRIKVKG